MCSTLYAGNTCHDSGLAFCRTVGLRSLCPPNLGLLAGATTAGKEIFKAPMSVHLRVLCISNRVRSMGRKEYAWRLNLHFTYISYISISFFTSPLRLDMERKMCILTSKLNRLMLTCYKCFKLTVQKEADLTFCLPSEIPTSFTDPLITHP